MKKFLFCFGTRPEAIKMAPLIQEVIKEGHRAVNCISGQHHEMLIPFLEFFNIEVHYNLEVMKEGQGLSSLTAQIVTGVDKIITKEQPDCIIVQGDTTTTFSSALSGFYNKIPVAHIEAGLRTFDKYSPFPEEANRMMVSSVANFHFPPTELAKKYLNEEKVTKNVIVTGNTSIDALRLTSDRIDNSELKDGFEQKYSMLDKNKKLILVTAHRRENHGEPLVRICDSLLEIAKNNDIQVVFPVHLNPNVQKVVREKFKDISNVYLLDPLNYTDFIWFMKKAHVILSDSGGVQEEAPFFKKPVLVLRENTERAEGLEAGTSVLVGTDKDLIISQVDKTLNDETFYSSFNDRQNPFGDGFASEKIVKYLIDNL